MVDVETVIGFFKQATAQAIVAIVSFICFGYIAYRALIMSLDRIIEVRYQLFRLLCWSPVVLVVGYLAMRLGDARPPGPTCRLLADVPYLNCNSTFFRSHPVAVLFACITMVTVSIHYGKLQMDIYIVAKEVTLAILGLAVVLGVSYAIHEAATHPEFFRSE